MSRQKLKVRDKITQKMSRNGVVESNVTSGEDIRISSRETEFDIRSSKPEKETLSQLGTRFDAKSKSAITNPNSHKKTSQRHNKALRESETAHTQINDTPTVTVQNNTEQSHNTPDIPQHQTSSVTSINPRDPPNQTDGADKLNTDKRHESPAATPPQKNMSESTAVFDDNTIKPTHSAPTDKSSSTGKLKNRSNTVFQEQLTTTIQYESDSDVSPLKHQREKPSFSENEKERSTTSKEKGGKTTKRKNAKYRQKQSFTIQHEPQKSVSMPAHGKEAAQSVAATVIQPDTKSKLKTQRETVLRHNQAEIKAESHNLEFEMPNPETPLSQKQDTDSTTQTEAAQVNDTFDIPRDVPQNRPVTPPDNQLNPIIRGGKKGRIKQNRDTVYRHNKPDVLQPEQQKSDSQLTHKQETEKPTETRQVTDTPQATAEKPRNPATQPKTQSAGQTAAASQTTDKPAKKDAPIDNEAQTVETEPSSADNAPTSNNSVKDVNPDTSLKHDKSGKLKFADDEVVPEKTDKKPNRKLEKAERKSEQAGKKLEKAKGKLPSKRKLRSERVFDEQKGKAKRKLHFDKEVKSQGQHLKGALPLRPVKARANALMLNAHRKIYQVEHENVAVKAAHRVEMIGEAGIRSALRHHKTAPYKKVTKLEKQAAKKTIKLNYQKALANNPKLKSNMLSRMWQKRKIKKDYAKTAREAKKTAERAKKAGSYTVRASKAIVQGVIKNPKVLIIVAVLFLLVILLMSLFSLGSSIGNGGLTAILSSSYLADDGDIEQAELSYSEWETDLQFQILNAESSHPNYDEYRYDVGDISHNPYELMAYLTAAYQNFSYDGIAADLQALFNEQYSLTFTPSTETRYADPTDANEDGDYEPYDWNVLTVKLTARSFNDVILTKMTAEQQAHYALLMQTKGNRQYTGNPFDVGWLPYVTSNYGYRVHPITGAKDLHRGVDIVLPAGTEIRSTQDGTVTIAGYSGGYGNVVVIENDKGITTKYAHCDTISVSVGQSVSMGDVIATVGNTGDSTGAHLHYEVLKNGEYFNPLIFADTGSFNLFPSYGTPGLPMGDGSYAALIAEAESHLGKPYVFGSNGPNSFDCSSYICFILTQSGVKNMPRTTAQGIFNQCTPIPESERQPGDLVFFHSTYSTANTVTHVGLYVGNGWMIHAGSPVQYTQIDGNSYWTAHLYSYGRLN